MLEKIRDPSRSLETLTVEKPNNKATRPNLKRLRGDGRQAGLQSSPLQMKYICLVESNDGLMQQKKRVDVSAATLGELRSALRSALQLSTSCFDVEVLDADFGEWAVVDHLQQLPKKSRVRISRGYLAAIRGMQASPTDLAVQVKSAATLQTAAGYAGSGSDAVRADISSAGGTEALLAMLVQWPTDAKATEAALVGLWKLSRLAEVRVKLRSDGVRMVAEAFTRHMKNARVALACAAVLGNVCASAELRSEVGATGAGASALTAISTHLAKSLDVVMTCLFLLTNLCAGHPANCNLVISAGGLPLIAALMSAYEQRPKVLARAATTVAAVVEGGSSGSADDCVHLGTDTMACTLRYLHLGKSDHLDTCQSLSLALRNLCQKNTAVRIALSADRGVLKIASAMRRTDQLGSSSTAKRCRANFLALFRFLTGCAPSIERVNCRATISARSTFSLDISVPAGGMLEFEWDVAGKGLDCGFTVAKGGVEVHWEGMQKASAHGLFGATEVVNGLWSAIADTKVTLKWSNAHSRFREKRVSYSIRLYTPCASAVAKGGEAEATQAPTRATNTGHESAGIAAFNEVFYGAQSQQQQQQQQQSDVDVVGRLH